MSEKVKVSKEVAEALDKLIALARERNTDDPLQWILEAHRLERAGDWDGDLEPIKHLSLSKIAHAYINDYEVERTPEEAFSELYDEAFNVWMKSGSNIDRAHLDGMKETIKVLKLKIEGVDLDV